MSNHSPSESPRNWSIQVSPVTQKRQFGATSFSQEYTNEATPSEGAIRELASNSSDEESVPNSRTSIASSYISTGTSKIEYLILFLIIFSIFFLLLVPIGLHFLPDELPSNKTSVENCSNTSAWVATGSKCSSVAYSGVCQDYLQFDCSDDVYVDSSVNINQSNSNATLFNTVIAPLIPEGKCKDVAFPFLCQVFFPLCNDTQLFLPSQEECVNISTVTCSLEWSFAKSTNYSYLLPNCSSLPNKTQGGILPANDLYCSEGFYLEGTTCFPSCTEWNTFGKGYSIAHKFLAIISAVVAIVASIALFIVAGFRHKRMFTFPSVFLVIMTFWFFVLAILLLFGLINGGDLYCSSKNVIINARNDPTPFCKLSGAIFQYFIITSCCWWFFHVWSTFYKMAFPIKSVQHKKRQFAFNIMLTIIGVVLPAVFVIAPLTVQEFYYAVPNHPPLFFCFSRNVNYVFYTHAIPVYGFLSVGLSLLVLIVWLLHKYQGILRARRKGFKKLHLTTPEKKLLFSFIFYSLFAIIVVVYTSLASHNPDKKIFNYFQCEAKGNTSNCEKEQNALIQAGYPYLTNILEVLLGMIPFVNLVFVVNWNYLKEKIKQQIEKNKMYVTLNEGEEPLSTNYKSM